MPVILLGNQYLEHYCYRNNKSSNEISVYNFTSIDNPITWDDLKVMSAKYGLELPTSRAVWYYSFGNTKSKILHLFYIYFLHLLPALLVDAVSVCVGKQPRWEYFEFLVEFLSNEPQKHLHVIICLAGC